MDLGIYEDISRRTKNDIYAGVVGPVRTGKSTFIKKFMDILVVPNIENKYKRERAIDELPQSGSGRTITTCEPKFVPAEAANIRLGEVLDLNVRLVDCVGYVVNGALGATDEEGERMVRTPWSDNPMPFSEAAEIGTKKVIDSHSTIGIVVTTDGSISGIDRENYLSAESRVIEELKKLNKPFVVVVNTTNPSGSKAMEIAEELREKYNASVVIKDVMHMTESDIEDILTSVLYEFPVKEINYSLPRWIENLGEEHYLSSQIYDLLLSLSNPNDSINDIVIGIEKRGDGSLFTADVNNVNLSSGEIYVNIDIPNQVLYRIISEENGIEIENEFELFNRLSELTDIKQRYEKIASALSVAMTDGYGVVNPDFKDYTLKTPEMFNKSGRHGVKITASAPALHIICTEVNTEVTPTIGSLNECEAFYDQILDQFENDQEKIWECEFFGRNLKDMISDSMQNKLMSIDDQNKIKVQKTLTKIVNSGKGGVIILWL